MKKIKVFIADDHAVLRAGLIKLLNAEPDIETVGEAGNGEDAVSKAVELKPDVLLLDLTMPGMGGIEVVHALKLKKTAVKILILTMHEDEGYLREALKAGVLGYVPKKAADAELLSAIRAVNRGDIYIHPSMAKGLVQEALHVTTIQDVQPVDAFQSLSQREVEVLRLIAQGFTNQEIADKLFISVKTVETYKARLMEKIQLASRAELVRFALHHGLLKSD